MTLKELYQICEIEPPKVAGLASNLHEKIIGFSIDSRTINNGEVFIAIKGQNYDGYDFIATIKDKMKLAISEKPVLDLDKERQLIVASSVDTLGKIAGFHFSQCQPEHCWVINGSNGKTTTKNILAQILSAEKPTLCSQGNFNNEIGLPLSILKMSLSHKFAVFEIGANHVGEIDKLVRHLKPTGVIITNASEAHLKGFTSLANIKKAKGEALNHLGKDGFAVLNFDDSAYSYWQEVASHSMVYSIGFNKGADIIITNVQAEELGYKFEIKTPWWTENFAMPLLGEFNIKNASFAIIAGYLSGVGLDSINRSLKKIKVAEGRFQLAKLNANLIVINDAYNANPTSVEQGILAAKQLANKYAEHKPTKLAVFLGNMNELGKAEEFYHSHIGNFADDKVDWLGTFGSLAELTKRSFSGAGVVGSSRENLVKEFVDNEYFANFKKVSWIVYIKGSRSSQMDLCLDLLKEYVRDNSLYSDSINLEELK